VFTRFFGTIMQYILLDQLFWGTICVFIGVRLFDTYYVGEDESFFEAENVIPNSDSITTIGTFLSLILTFFISQARSDYAASYSNSMTAKGKIIEMATVTKTVLPLERADRLVRYLNAAHLVGYVGLSRTYGRDNFFNEFNNEMNVLTDKELNRIDEVDSSLTGGICCWDIATWAMQDIQNALNAGEIDNRGAASLRTIVLDFRGAMSKMFNDSDQPAITFFYFHLVSFLCVVYLPLFAMYSAFQANQHSDGFTLSDVVQLIVVFVQCCYVIGMRILAIKLMDPFGDDPEDLSVMTFIRTGWETSNEILNAKFPDVTAFSTFSFSPNKEKEIGEKVESLGKILRS
jgi:hypothetical protein